MSDDLRRQLDALREEHARLERQVEAMRDAALVTTRELQAAMETQRVELERAGEATASLAAIRASNSGRLAAWLDRLLQRRRSAAMRREAADARYRAAGRTRRVPPAVMSAPVGVNVAGYINAESGMGEATRCSIRALTRAGFPVALNNVPGPQRMADTSFTAFVDDNPQPFNLIHLNADNMSAFAADRGRAYYADRYTIGYWFWELEAFRDDWLPAFELVDEVWVATEHTRRSIGRNASVPVVHMPLGLPDPAPGDYGRAHFGLPDRPFIFLYTFDVSSQMERKNPMGAVHAFREAGLAHDEAMLLLKFTNAHTNRDAVDRLVHATEGLNVHLIDGALERDEVAALMRATDCCLSLHRAEGFGLTIAEQMALGKPAIATAYSGNVDFMTSDVSCLVPARLVPIDRDYGPYLRGMLWADPDLDEAARFIRELARSPNRARELGERGRAHVTRVLSLDRSAAMMARRLEQIRSGDPGQAGAAPPVDIGDGEPRT